MAAGLLLLVGGIAASSRQADRVRTGLCSAYEPKAKASSEDGKPVRVVIAEVWGEGA
jgi:hypothetical protein